METKSKKKSLTAEELRWKRTDELIDATRDLKRTEQIHVYRLLCAGGYKTAGKIAFLKSKPSGEKRKPAINPDVLSERDLTEIYNYVKSVSS